MTRNLAHVPAALACSDRVAAQPPSDSASTSSVSKSRITCFISPKLGEIGRFPDRICSAQVQVSVAQFPGLFQHSFLLFFLAFFFDELLCILDKPYISICWVGNLFVFKYSFWQRTPGT